MQVGYICELSKFSTKENLARKKMHLLENSVTTAAAAFITIINNLKSFITKFL